MLREVTIEEYWPLIVKNTAEFQQIAVAENPEFNKLAECIYRVLEDGFIADATEYGVERWEKMLGITPAEGSSLDDRKAAILTQLSVKIPYTWRVLKQMLVPILGGEDKFVMEYVNDEGKLVIHTDRISDDKLHTIQDLLERVLPQNIEVEHYNHHIEISWRDINKYAECRYGADIMAVNPNYKNDVTSDGEWVYPLPEMINPNDGCQVTSNGRWAVFCWNSTIKKVEISLPKAITIEDLYRGSRVLKWVKITAPEAISSNRMLSECDVLEYAEVYAPKALNDGWSGQLFGYSAPKLERAKLYLPKAKLFNLVADNLRELELKLPSLTSQRSNSVIAQLNKDSAIVLLNSLPTTQTTGQFTIGIHIDHENDEEVWAAISNAKAKGWTIPVRWNGIPTSGVSTLDLEEIYAKVTESEYGEYTDENGTRCTLDWGHYVTDTTDYKLFFSLVEAEQYFKLTRIENNE